MNDHFALVPDRPHNEYASPFASLQPGLVHAALPPASYLPGPRTMQLKTEASPRGLMPQIPVPPVHRPLQSEPENGFTLSLNLQDALTSGSVRQQMSVDQLMDEVYREAEQHAQARKKVARQKLKTSATQESQRLISKERSLLRSRIEAKVSRVKSQELENALKSALRWMVAHAIAARSEQCSRCTR